VFRQIIKFSQVPLFVFDCFLVLSYLLVNKDRKKIDANSINSSCCNCCCATSWRASCTTKEQL